MHRTDHILVVDDDPEMVELLEDYLSSNDFAVSTAMSGAAMRQALERESVSMILLDLNLPDESGFDLARELRVESSIPIIMITGRNDDMDRIAGLEIGADDYVAKPFNMRELVARIRTVLRRASQDANPTADQSDTETAIFLGWRLNVTNGRLFDPKGREVKLTAGEFRMLKALASHPNRVLSREQLLEYTSGVNADSFDRSVDIQVMRLRRKIETDGGRTQVIKTVRGLGYMFLPAVEWR